MIERYRESWFTDFLEQTMGEWTGAVLIGIGLALAYGLHSLLKYAPSQTAEKKDPDHERRKNAD